jgi:hypothetical protein
MKQVFSSVGGCIEEGVHGVKEELWMACLSILNIILEHQFISLEGGIVSSRDTNIGVRFCNMVYDN